MAKTDETTARVILVLGGTGGIGSAICRRLLSEGATVVSASRSGAGLPDIPEGERADRISYSALDATDFDQVDELTQRIQSQHDRLSGLVNAVGSMLLKPAHLTTREEWEDVLSANLTSAFAAVRSAAKVMRRTGGSIVLLASAAAATGLHNHEAIAAAKAGVAGLARSAAATYARSGIRVNSVAPGMVETPLSEPLLSNAKARAASEALHPLGRIGTPEEIASAVCWLLHPDQSWVTGQTLGVDGGLAAARNP